MGFWVWLNVLWLNIYLKWACVCVVVIALVWIFRFQMNGDFWVSNERWLDGCSLYRHLGWCQWVLKWVILCVSYWVSEICYCLASLLLLLLWPLSPLLLLLKVFVEMLHRVLVYLFVFCLLFSFLFGFLC